MIKPSGFSLNSLHGMGVRYDDWGALTLALCADFKISRT